MFRFLEGVAFFTGFLQHFKAIKVIIYFSNGHILLSNIDILLGKLWKLCKV